MEISEIYNESLRAHDIFSVNNHEQILHPGLPVKYAFFFAKDLLPIS